LVSHFCRSAWVSSSKLVESKTRIAEAYRLEILQDLFVHPILLKIYLNIFNDVVDDRAIHLRLEEEE